MLDRIPDGPMNAWYAEMVTRTGQMMAEGWLWTVVATLGGLFVAAVITWKPPPRRLWPGLVIALILASVSVGATLVWAERAVVDDAFISFRYADNLLSGNGLVWNRGEYVEGITNIGWTLLLAILSLVSGFELPDIALWMCVASWFAAIGGTAATSWQMGHRVPMAACLLAVQLVFCAFATTGLETMAIAAFVAWGAFSLARGEDPRSAGLAGFLLSMATIMRPDQFLFLLAGAVALGARRAWPGLKMYCLMPVIGGPLIVFKLAYYGSITPNTYYAKAAYLWYPEQGGIYLFGFLMGTHFWLIVLIGLAGWLLKASPEVTRIRWFAFTAFALFVPYVLKVGGDFMYGRFFVSLIPLLLLAAEATAVQLYGRQARAGLAIGVLLASTATGIQLNPDRKIQWRMAWENSYYRLESTFPVVVNHQNRRAGQKLGRLLTDRGFTPLIATSGIGMFGFYSRLPILDTHGLTDAEVAQIDVGKRGYPGHEKSAPGSLLTERGVRIRRKKCHMGEWFEMTRLELGPNMPKDWCIWVYEKSLMTHLHDTAPELRFKRFPRWFRKVWLKDAKNRTPKQIKADIVFFERYYFAHNPDGPAMRKQAQAFLR